MEYRAIVKRKSDRELKHWKYIRREYDLDSGEYRYYYDNVSSDEAARSKEYDTGLGTRIKYKIKDAIGSDEKAAYNTMENTVRMHQDYIDSMNKRRKELVEDIDEDGVRTDTEQSWLDYLVDPSIESEKRDLKNAQKTLETALSAYEKTPIYKIDKTGEKIKSGSDAVKNTFKKLVNRRRR